MEITEKQKSNNVSEVFPVRRISSDGLFYKDDSQAMKETVAGVYFNEKFIAEIPCTPDHLPEMAVGWLMSEKKINCSETEGSVIIQGDADDPADPLKIVITVPEASSAASDQNIILRKTNNFHNINLYTEQNRRWLYQLLDRFDVERPLRRFTKASHSCMLVKIFFDENEIYHDLEVLFQSEDAGRHTAMDKAIGWGILNRTEMSDCILFTSGRISRSMALKASASGVACLATAKPLVTTGAVEEAEKGGIALLGIDDITREVIIFR